jgi:hypothetical protein
LGKAFHAGHLFANAERSALKPFVHQDRAPSPIALANTDRVTGRDLEIGAQLHPFGLLGIGMADKDLLAVGAIGEAPASATAASTVSPVE